MMVEMMVEKLVEKMVVMMVALMDKKLVVMKENLLVVMMV